MNGNQNDIVFIEHGTEQVTDKPHCGGCYAPAEEDTSTTVVTDKPHCGDC